MSLRRTEWLGLLGLSATAFLIHGYHPYSEDAEIYLSGIEKMLKPSLFPTGEEYFQLHGHLTWFPQLVAWPTEWLHLPLPWVLLAWQLASFFLLLLACFTLMRKLFPSPTAAWSGVALIAALFTMPVAGTALYIMDPFLNPRNVIAFAEIFAIVKAMERRYFSAAVCLVFAASVHPLMTAYSVTFALLLVAVDRLPHMFPLPRPQEMVDQEDPSYAAPALFLFAPVEGLFNRPTDAYDHVAALHRYQFLSRWTWYEMLGAIAPPVIFMWFATFARRRGMRSLELLSWTTAMYGAIYFVGGYVVSLPHRLEVFTLFQPMRSLRVLYILMILVGGGLLGEFVLKNRVWRWLALFIPLSAGMCWAQRVLYPESQHIEWPTAPPTNRWAQAFDWIRTHTPQDAVFAMDPYYMAIRGEDTNGFRIIAQRSRLADGSKDSGVAELFPNVAEQWSAQVQAQTGIDSFQPQDFERLRHQYGVSWVVLRQPQHSGLDCPYSNTDVAVCRLP